jgi:hypothetical protein
LIGPDIILKDLWYLEIGVTTATMQVIFIAIIAEIKDVLVG